jgi:class 3 adenylate cyclase
MNDNSNRTFVASVLFLDIVDYSEQPVSEQMVMKRLFNTLLIDAVQSVAAADRVVLDTGDGAAITFLGNPEDALFTAFAMRDAIANAATGQQQAPFKVRFGINLGPVRQIRDINGQVNMIGDGINIAQRIMSFGDPGVILVSRSYFEVVSCLSADLAGLFHYDGKRTDKHVREHSVYSVGNSTATPLPVTEPVPTAKSEPPEAIAVMNDEGSPDDSAPAPQPAAVTTSRMAIIVTLVVLLGAGAMLLRSNTAPAPPAAVPAAITPADEPLGEATVSLAISPWGEVWLNGKKSGVSPPLKTLTLPPGKHMIEVRNTSFPPYTQTVTGGGGKSIQIQHTFRAP